MADNDFLPFAVGPSANVLTQAEYEALTAILQNGFQSGIAQSVQLNKVWRQSTIMAAVLAQFISDRTGQDAIDDGTITTLLANLKASAAALNGDPTKTFQVAPATASNQAVTMSQVQNLAGMRNLVGINNATNPNTQFDISADQVLVRNPTTGLVVNVVGSLKTNDITVAGPAANGRDQAAAFTASTWIHLYWIYNPTTSTLATITSANAPTTGPTLPAGYTHWAYIHALFLGAGPALPVVRIRNQRSTYVLAQTSLNLGGSTSAVSVNVASLVPPNALDFSIAIQTIAILSSGSGGAATTVFLEVANGAATHRAAFTLTAVAASTQFSMSGPSFEMPNIGQQYLYANVIGSGSSPQTTQAIESYTVSNGAA